MNNILNLFFATFKKSSSVNPNSRIDLVQQILFWLVLASAVVGLLSIYIDMLLAEDFQNLLTAKRDVLDHLIREQAKINNGKSITIPLKDDLNITKICVVLLCLILYFGYVIYLKFDYNDVVAIKISPLLGLACIIIGINIILRVGITLQLYKITTDLTHIDLVISLLEAEQEQKIQLLEQLEQELEKKGKNEEALLESEITPVMVARSIVLFVVTIIYCLWVS